MTADNTGENPPDATQLRPSQPMSMDALSNLAGSAGAKGVAAALTRAGEATGVGFDLLYNMARRESSLDPSAKAKTSSAAGLFQFIEQTWLGAVKKYGAKYGLADDAAAITQTASGKYVVADADRRASILDQRFDASKAAHLAGELIGENKTGLERRLGRDVGAAEVYAAHFLGLGGASKLLGAAPDASAAALLPKAAAANRPVFYDGARARSVEEVMAAIGKSMGLAETENSAAAGATLNETAVMASAIETAPLKDLPISTRRDAPEKKFADHPAASFDLAASPARIRQALSPLAFAVLQALDPTRLGADRTERREALR